MLANRVLIYLPKYLSTQYKTKCNNYALHHPPLGPKQVGNVGFYSLRLLHKSRLSAYVYAYIKLVLRIPVARRSLSIIFEIIQQHKYILEKCLLAMKWKFWGRMDKAHSIHIGVNTNQTCPFLNTHCGHLWQHAGGRGETTYLPIYNRFQQFLHNSQRLDKKRYVPWEKKEQGRRAKRRGGAAEGAACGRGKRE